MYLRLHVKNIHQLKLYELRKLSVYARFVYIHMYIYKYTCTCKQKYIYNMQYINSIKITSKIYC